jgi:hypothetical protein
MPIHPTTAAYLAKVLPLLQVTDNEDQIPSVLYHLNYAQNCPPSAYGSRDLTV